MACASGTSCFVSRRALSHGHRRGFSLLELIVVISITSLLAGLLMPALSSVRESARRVLCGSNQRQIGQSLTMYSGDRQDRLPVASALDMSIPDPGLLLMVRNGSRPNSTFLASGDKRVTPIPLKDSSWDGLGHIFQWHYCDNPSTFYCPSHKGEHVYSECSEKWEAKTIAKPLFSNYHYVGHKDWRTGKRRSLNQGHKLVLATDGLRTKSDYSHGVGYNILRGDGSVTWHDDVVIRTQLSQLPPIDFFGLRDLDDLIYRIFSSE